MALAISAASLAANGKTLTFTVTGAGANLTCTSGFQIHLSGGSDHGGLAIASIACTGTTTVTLTLSAYRLPGDTIQWDYTAGDLTDGTLTLGTSTNNAVTNNSTKTGSSATFAYNNAAVLDGGQFSTGALGGRAIRFGNGTASETRYQFTGAQIEVLCYTHFGANWNVSVDGGTRAAMAMPNNQTGGTSGATAWQWMPLSTGVSDATHTLSYYCSDNSFSGVDPTNACIRVTGASPAVSRESAFAGTPTRLDGGTLPTGMIANYSAPLATGASTQGYTGYLRFPWQTAQFRIRAKCSALKIWGLSLEQDWVISVDGVDGAALHIAAAGMTASTGQSWGWWTAPGLTGLDDTAYHDYTVTAISQFSNGPQSSVQFFVEILPVHDNAGPNGAGGIDTNAPAAFPTTALETFGNSITQQTIPTGTDVNGGTITDSRIGFGWLIAQSLNYQLVNRGISATTLHNFGGTAAAVCTNISGESRVHADLSTLTTTATAALVDLYGTNDLTPLLAGGSQPAGNSSPISATTFSTSFINTYTDYLTAFPTAKLLCCTILERSEANNTADGTYGIGSANNVARLGLNTKKSLGVASLAGSFPSADIRYVSLEGVIIIVAGANPTASTDTVDGLHPIASGHAKIANRLKPHVAATGFTVSGGSSSIVVGQTTATFTITRAGGSTWETGDKIALSATDGSFSVSGGTVAGSGASIVVTPTVGNTTFTYTYTPASAGNKTVTPTTNATASTALWSNPAASSVTATAASAGGAGMGMMGMMQMWGMW